MRSKKKKLSVHRLIYSFQFIAKNIDLLFESQANEELKEMKSRLHSLNFYYSTMENKLNAAKSPNLSPSELDELHKQTKQRAIEKVSININHQFNCKIIEKIFCLHLVFEGNGTQF